MTSSHALQNYCILLFLISSSLYSLFSNVLLVYFPYILYCIFNINALLFLFFLSLISLYLQYIVIEKRVVSQTIVDSLIFYYNFRSQSEVEYLQKTR